MIWPVPEWASPEYLEEENRPQSHADVVHEDLETDQDDAEFGRA